MVLPDSDADTGQEIAATGTRKELSGPCYFESYAEEPVLFLRARRIAVWPQAGDFADSTGDLSPRGSCIGGVLRSCDSSCVLGGKPFPKPCPKQRRSLREIEPGFLKSPLLLFAFEGSEDVTAARPGPKLQPVQLHCLGCSSIASIKE